MAKKHGMIYKTNSRLGYLCREAVGKERGKGSLTNKATKEHLQRIGDYMSTLNLKNPEQIRTKHIEKMFDHLEDKGASKSTMGAYATAMNKLLTAIDRTQVMPSHEDFKERITRTAEDRENPQTLDREKWEEIKEKIGAKREYEGIMIEMAEKFGLREKETVLSHKVTFIDGEPHLVVEGAKGNRPRTVKIENREQADLIVQNEKLRARNNGKLAPADIPLKTVLNRLSQRMNYYGATRENGANLHAARHDYAQRLKASGATNKEIMSRLGHGSKRSTGAYIPK